MKALHKPLQAMVREAEDDGAFKSFDLLCQKLADTDFARAQKLNAETIGKMLIEHDIDTKTKKPKTVEASKPAAAPPPPPKPEPKPAPTPPAAPAPAPSTGPGKGKKLCSQCNQYVAAAAKACPHCKHVFKKKGEDDLPPVAAPVATVSMPPRVEYQESYGDAPLALPYYDTHRGRVIAIPGGLCPVQLKGTSYEEVQRWAQSVLDAGAKDHLYYQKSALKYYVRYFYDFGSTEHRTVCDTLEALFLQTASASAAA
jgi:hypothetical protein